MVNVTIDRKALILEVQGWDKLWTLTSRLEIPLAHIRGVRQDTDLAAHPQGWRVETHIPGVLTAGTLHHDGQRLFWDVHDAAQTIVIDLADERYDQLIVEVADPEAVIEQIQQALGSL